VTALLVILAFFVGTFWIALLVGFWIRLRGREEE
jgi:hypothetical protein